MDAVMNETVKVTMNVDGWYGFAGFGQMGGNIVKSIHEKGFSNILAANTAQSDLDGLDIPEECKYHILGGYGSNKDRKKAKQLLADNNCENFDLLVNEIKERFKDCKVIFLIGSTGGGSGSAIVPAVKRRLQAETDKIICVVTCMPDDNASIKEFMNCYEFFQELESIEGNGATFIIDNNKNEKKLILNEQFACYLEAFLNGETASARGVVDRAEIDNVLSQRGACIVNKQGSDKATTQTIVEKIRDNIYAPLEDDGVVANIALINSNDDVRLKEVAESVGKPLATFEGWEADATVLAVSGCSFPYKKLEEFRQKIEDDKDTIKKNLTATSERKLTGSIDFLDDIEAEKPKTEKKKSNRDWLFM